MLRNERERHSSLLYNQLETWHSNGETLQEPGPHLLPTQTLRSLHSTKPININHLKHIKDMNTS